MRRTEDPFRAIEDMRAALLKQVDRLDPREPVAAKVAFRVKKDREQPFVAQANALVDATTTQDGCRFFTFGKAPTKGGGDERGREYWTYEDWWSAAQYRKQLESPHLARFLQSLPEVLIEPPQPPSLLQEVREAPRPVPSAPPGGAPAQPPKTGQKDCWDRSGRPVDCANSGHDGQYQAGMAWPFPRFQDNGDGTVTDRLTDLIWLRNANFFREVSWPDALGRVQQIASGNTGLSDGSKRGDWRVPNVNELQSLLDLSNTEGVAVSRNHPFTDLSPANYWSSTSVAAFPALAWYVAMAVGPPVFDMKVNAMRLWPVRGISSLVPRTGQKETYGVFGQPLPPGDPLAKGQDGDLQMGVHWPSPRFDDNSDGTVTDRLTGLTWLKDGNPFGTVTWEDGLERCARLASGGHPGLDDGSRPGDWRMPNVNELRSLEDYGAHTPALPNGGQDFRNVRQSLCWSSTTVASAPNLARFLFVGIGSCVWDHKGVSMGCWPVKGGL